MARRYGGEYSPGGDPRPETERDADRARRDARRVDRRARLHPVGARVNLLFIAPFLWAFSAFFRDPAGMAQHLGVFALLMLSAWLTREGVVAQDAYDERRVARRPAIPRKIFASVVMGLGLALAGFGSDFGLAVPIFLGVIGGALVTEGALVNADSGNPLATIQQIDPVYADFTQPAGDLLSIRRDIAAGRLAAPPSGGSVKLVFDDGSVHEKPGTLLFSSATVDSTTGQVTLRAEFPNPNRDLLPGLYVRIRIEQAIRKNALTVPQRAVLRDATGAATVFVVGAGNKAEARAVTLGPALEGDWLVIDGLKDGDKAVVEGGQKLQPGMEVAPEEWKPAAATDAAATQPAK